MTFTLFIGIILGLLLRPAVDRMLANYNSNNNKRPTVSSKPLVKSNTKCLEKLAQNNGAQILQKS